jgi:hypothetical protein
LRREEEEMEKVSVRMRDIQRYKVLTEVLEKKLLLKDGSEIMGVSYRHAIRLKEKVEKEGFEGLLRQAPLTPPNKRITNSVVDDIIKLRKEIYYDFNVNHLKDKLEEAHGIRVCYESLRQILIKAGEHHPRKKRVVHRQRRRMPKAGMLVQMDSSQHQWLSSVPETWWLIAMIDDATNEVPYGWFSPKDTLFANMQVIRRFIEIKGLFMSLYVDQASHFTTTRQGGLHYTVNQEQGDTQIERALKELDITLIPAHSPQAKGRIEVTFRLFQDRLIKEMRVRGIRTYDEANQFLFTQFLPWYNTHYTHAAESAYAPLPREKNLDLIFCIKKERRVNNDNTIIFQSQVIQIPPTEMKLSLARSKVEVCLLEDKRIFVVYKGKIVAQSILSPENKGSKKEEKIDQLLNQRKYIPVASSRRRKPPSPDHPWRRPLPFFRRCSRSQGRVRPEPKESSRPASKARTSPPSLAMDPSRLRQEGRGYDVTF